MSKMKNLMKTPEPTEAPPEEAEEEKKPKG